MTQLYSKRCLLRRGTENMKKKNYEKRMPKGYVDTETGSLVLSLERYF